MSEQTRTVRFNFLALILYVVCAASSVRGATLIGTFTPIPQGTDVNLTAEGPLDWVHWGLFTDSSLDRKAGVTPRIPNFTPVKMNGPFQYADNYNGYSWSDGNPTRNATKTPTGVWMYGKANGFELQFQANTTPQTLKIYVGTFGAVGKFTATLSGTSLSYTDSSITNDQNGPGGVYTLDVAANTPGQVLDIKYLVDQTFDSAGNVTLQAAALTAPGANNPPVVSISDPADGANFSANGNITITADAADTDGMIAKVEFFQGNAKLGESTTSPYSLTWSNAPAGNYLLTARASDDGGATRTSAPLEIFVNGTGGTLSGSVALPTNNFGSYQVDLTADGTADWTHWGLSSPASFDHKAGVPFPQEISNFTTIGTNPTQGLLDYVTKFSWSDGTPTGSAGPTPTGVFIHGSTNGFRITAPADTTGRTLRVYVGLYGAEGKFQAYLSDHSAPAYTDTSLSSIYGNPPAVYILDYRAASSGQTLIVEYTARTLFDAVYGNVSLEAATLSGASLPINAPPTVSLSSPTNDASFTAGANITLQADANDSDGSVAKVEFFAGATLLGTATGSPYSFTWTAVPAGNYSLTAKATDNQGAAATSAAVSITVNPANVSPSVSITSPTNGAVLIAPATFTVQASASDSDGSVAQVQFFNGTTSLGIDTGSPYSASANNLAAGPYTLSAVATDNLGATATNSVNITVDAPPTVILSSPTNNASFTAGANVMLQASASDSDGSVAKVEFFAGATLLGTATGSPYSFTWTAVPAGNYSLTAKATDNQGAAATSGAVSITVNPANVSPSVTIISPTNGAVLIAPATFTVQATASDSDGSVAQVQFFNGTISLGIDTSSPYSASINNLAAGPYMLSAVATDNLGATATNSINIVVDAPPTVSLSSPTNNASFTAGANITLQANANDSDGSVVEVEFFAGATLLGTATGSPYSFTWTAVPAGNYSLTAKATDNQGATATSAAVSITVNLANVSPSVTIISPTNGAVLIAPATFTVQATTSDSDGSVAQVQFFNGTISLGIDTSSPYSASINNLAAGPYMLSAVATDNLGATATNSINIVVGAPPTVGLSSPTNNASFTAGANITLQADANDSDGSVAKVEFFAGATLLGTATGSPYSFTWTAVPAGNYSLTAKATDNQGAAATSAAVSITVNPANVSPNVTIISPTNGAVLIAPATFTVQATASDSDGSVAQVQFFDGTTSLGIDISSPYSASANNLAAGPYTLSAVATDNLGATATNSVNIVVDAPPTVTITSPTNSATFTAPADITITADASDSDGSISKVEFFEGVIRLGETTNAPYSTVWSNMVSGSYLITAKVTDNVGAVATSIPVNITVNSNTAAPVTLLNPLANGNRFSFSFFTESNRTYTVEQTMTLSPVNWQTLTNMVGDGNVLSATNAIQVETQQFYRVKAE